MLSGSNKVTGIQDKRYEQETDECGPFEKLKPGFAA
jgi:hypothetical protein